MIPPSPGHKQMIYMDKTTHGNHWVYDHQRVAVRSMLRYWGRPCMIIAGSQGGVVGSAGWRRPLLGLTPLPGGSAKGQDSRSVHLQNWLKEFIMCFILHVHELLLTDINLGILLDLSPDQTLDPLNNSEPIWMNSLKVFQIKKIQDLSWLLTSHCVVLPKYYMTSNRHVLKKKAERESKELQKFEGKWWKLYPTLRGALPIITQPSATNKSGKRVLLVGVHLCNLCSSPQSVVASFASFFEVFCYLGSLMLQNWFRFYQDQILKKSRSSTYDL